MNDALCCSACGEIIVKSVDGTVKIRSKVLILTDDAATAVCKGCGTEIPIPLKFDDNMVKSVMQTKKLRLYVNS